MCFCIAFQPCSDRACRVGKNHFRSGIYKILNSSKRASQAIIVNHRKPTQIKTTLLSFWKMLTRRITNATWPQQPTKIWASLMGKGCGVVSAEFWRHAQHHWSAVQNQGPFPTPFLSFNHRRDQPCHAAQKRSSKHRESALKWRQALAHLQTFRLKCRSGGCPCTSAHCSKVQQNCKFYSWSSSQSQVRRSTEMRCINHKGRWALAMVSN